MSASSTLPATPVVLPITTARPRRGAISISYGSDEHHQFLTRLQLPVPLAASMHVPDLSDLAIALTDVVDMVADIEDAATSSSSSSDDESFDLHNIDTPLAALAGAPSPSLLARRVGRKSATKNAKVVPLSLVVAVAKPAAQGAAKVPAKSAARTSAAQAI
ncbi:hypothetical protein BCR44DRAFT_44314 [Catenaria anguillulae PL171]|uniref:Uncharacterized protein n=1 Tax=Catenaria anguillulae PL171 TaxID=765915 RepID=A0A1Y2HT56_9FUNG|nr:hypothetical protein BCR44DRAFT_44314 [Catenaria anguillulae PL171]